MKISTTTSFVLTEAEIQEAVKQYIQANGYPLGDKDVEIVGELPQEVILNVTETIKNHSEKQQLPSSINSQRAAVVDHSTLEDTINQQHPNMHVQEEETVIQRPLAQRPFNPFADPLEPLTNNEAIQQKPKSSRIDLSAEPKVKGVVKQMPGKGIFD